MKDKQKRKKERTWAEAARMVLENFSDAPMTPKQILHVIQTKGLKEMRSGTAPLACLVTMLHSQVRGDRVKNSIFFKLPGRMSLFTLKKNALQWTKATEESEISAEAGSSTPPPASSSSPLDASSALGPTGPADATEQESCDSVETIAAVSGDNDASVDESSSSPSCTTEPQAPSSQPQTRLSRAAGQRPDTQGQQAPHTQTRLSRSRQSGRQRKKAVMMPRVVLTPLKVNGEHVTSGPMKRSRGGVDVDFETPGSILVNTNIRALINVRTFSAFPPHSQQQLLQLLPEVDRQVGPDGMARLSNSALNNEFFTHASQSWKERLAEGEFTHEMQVRFRQEMEKEKKVEAWKEKFFEEYHGQKSGLTREESLKLTMSEATEVAATVLDDGVAAVASSAPKRRSVGRRRRDGRMRRRTRADLRRRARRPLCKAAPVLQQTENTEPSAVLESLAVSEASPISDSTVIPVQMELQANSTVEIPGESTPTEPEPTDSPETPETVTLPAPVSSPSPASTSANEEPEVPPRLCAEEPAVALASASSPSSSSSSSASSPASSPSSPSDPQTFGTGLDSSSSSSASSAAVAADPLDDSASIVTSVTGGTATSSRESSPSASPATTPVPSAQHKEQKKRPDESQGFSSFPEKRPRLDDHQSFRTTINSVCSEKPQPTTEEPRVPPIRIQLSRIKPPWVKGHPTYQICPRIVPPGQGSRRSGTGGARTLADIKARAQQARAQREAAAAVAASAEGATPAGVGVQHSSGIHNNNSGRAAQEPPEEFREGRRERAGEHSTSADSNSSGTQLLLLNVEPTPQPLPAPSTTSTLVSLEPQQTPSPAHDTPEELSAGEGEKVAASFQPNDTADKATEPVSCGSRSDADQDQAPESASVHTESINHSCGSLLLAPTSIPDSLPRFGAQGVDVIQKLPSAHTEEQGQGVIQHCFELRHSAPPREHRDVPRCVHFSSVKKDDEAGVNSDSTETASDGETESHQPERDWGSSVNSPNSSNQKPVIQAHVSGRYGQTVIQHCSVNGLAQPHGPHPLPTIHTEGFRDSNEVKPDCVDKRSLPDSDCVKSILNSPTCAASSRRAVNSARPVSSVEANNPLVTQLLQGSLPLEKVLPSHPANRLEISRLPGSHPRTPHSRAEIAPQSPSLDLALSQNHKSPGGRGAVLTEGHSVSQQQVPVITSVPPPSSSSSRCKPESGSQLTPDFTLIKDSFGLQPSQGATPDRTLQATRTMLNGPSPPHADPCPTEGVPPIKTNWWPPQSLQQQSPAAVVKNEVSSWPSCQDGASSSLLLPVSVTKKEPVNSVDGYLSGGAMEGLLNMELALARMAKKDHSKGSFSSGSSPSSATPLPFQFYGKLSKQSGSGVSYTANVSVMDNGFSRSVAEGVLQLRPIQAFTDSAAEEVTLKCSCRLKAMIMCQGCGAFCHDDCIGPSKLCVSCLVVR